MRPLLLFFTGLVALPSVFAHCPLCTAAVGAGTVVSRFFGVDDTIFGVWFGAFLVSTTLMFEKRTKKVAPLQDLLLSTIVVALTLYSLYLAGIVGDLRYTLYGVDKLVLGTLAGALITYIVPKASKTAIRLRGQPFFPFQTLVLTLITLIVASAGFYVLTGVSA